MLKDKIDYPVIYSQAFNKGMEALELGEEWFNLMPGENLFKRRREVGFTTRVFASALGLEQQLNDDSVRSDIQEMLKKRY